MSRRKTALLPEEITHDMLFDLWFKVEVRKDRGDFFWGKHKGFDYVYAWAKLNCYFSGEKMYGFSLTEKMTREQLLKLEYSIKPKE